MSKAAESVEHEFLRIQSIDEVKNPFAQCFVCKEDFVVGDAVAYKVTDISNENKVIVMNLTHLRCAP